MPKQVDKIRKTGAPFDKDQVSGPLRMAASGAIEPLKPEKKAGKRKRATLLLKMET